MNNAQPLVSVVITTIGSDYIKKAIQSVKNQSYRNIEIIICYDGGFFENFQKVIEGEFNDIKFLNVGPFNNANNARQTGIEQANGQYIALLDDDDYWDTKHIELNIKEADKISNDKFILISNSIIIVNEKKQRILPERYFDDNKESVAEYLFIKINNKKTLMQTSSFFFTKELGMCCPFDRTLTLHQDYDWIIRINEMGFKIKQTGYNTSYYVQDVNVGSISKKSKANESIKWAFNKLKNYNPKVFLGFFESNTLWMMRNESIVDIISKIVLISKEVEIGYLHKCNLLFRAVFFRVKAILKKIMLK